MIPKPQQAALSPEAYRQLTEYCCRMLPQEACGILTGTFEQAAEPDHGPLLRVGGVHPVKNAADRPESRFAFDPEDWIRVLYGTQKNRQTLVGFFHSHPASPPVPSPADRNGLPAGSGGTSYWIVSPPTQQVRETLIRPYWLQDGRLSPIML